MPSYITNLQKEEKEEAENKSEYFFLLFSSFVDVIIVVVGYIFLHQAQNKLIKFQNKQGINIIMLL